MKLIRIAALSLLFTGISFNQPALAGNHPNVILTNLYPDKTVVIKHPAADNANSFFSGSQVYNFEIYKVGSDMNAIIKSFLSDKAVASCVAGQVTGDFSALTLVLNSNKDKAWFIAQFKKAGLNTIKINQKEVQGVDKM